MQTKVDCVDSSVDESEDLKRTVAWQREEIEELKMRVSTLERDLEEQKWGHNLIKDNDAKTMFYTGLPTFAVFLALFKYLEPKAERMQYWRGANTVEVPAYFETTTNKPGPSRRMPLIEEFFAVLVRLKLGLLLDDISQRFQMSSSHSSCMFITWISLLYLELKLLNPWPSRDQVARHTPQQFMKYPNTRVIIDCTEVFIERPTSLQSQAQTFSNYKHYNIFKVLISISPSGSITFASDLWGSRVPDRLMTAGCGIIDLLKPGDNVMADKGFDIQDLLGAKKIKLNIHVPPFLGKRQCFSPPEVEET